MSHATLEKLKSEVVTRGLSAVARDLKFSRLALASTLLDVGSAGSQALLERRLAERDHAQGGAR